MLAAKAVTAALAQGGDSQSQLHIRIIWGVFSITPTPKPSCTHSELTGPECGPAQGQLENQVQMILMGR